MPPSDNSAPTPAPDQTPAPVPEPPKKQSFWSKLFGGKKAAAPAVPESHESQTPPPRLDESSAEPTVVTPTPSPAPGLEQTPVVEPTPSEPSASATTDETAGQSKSGESLPPTLAVPQAIQGEQSSDNENNPTPLPTTPPSQDLAPPQPVQSNDGTQPTPLQNTPPTGPVPPAQ